MGMIVKEFMTIVCTVSLFLTEVDEETVCLHMLHNDLWWYEKDGSVLSPALCTCVTLKKIK